MTIFTSLFESKTDNSERVHDFLFWIQSLRASDAATAVALIGLAYYLQRTYHSYQTLHNKNAELKKEKANLESMNLELNELEAITNQQSTTLYLIQREVEARETKLNLSQREIAIRPIRNDSIPFTPYDPDAKPEDAIAMAQQATHNISHYIEETENELFSKRYQPSC